MRIELLVATEALQEQITAHVDSGQINSRLILSGLLFAKDLSWLVSLFDEDVKLFVAATTRSMRWDSTTMKPCIGRCFMKWHRQVSISALYLPEPSPSSDL